MPRLRPQSAAANPPPTADGYRESESGDSGKSRLIPFIITFYEDINTCLCGFVLPSKFFPIKDIPPGEWVHPSPLVVTVFTCFSPALKRFPNAHSFRFGDKKAFLRQYTKAQS